MFQQLKPMPADPILGLNQTFQQDQNPDKINLSIGVYQNADGETPIFRAVKQAELALLAEQRSKAYIPQMGDARYLKGSLELLLGEEILASFSDRIRAVMTPGGCGALRMLAELLVESRPNATVWVSDPTWPNHFPLLQSAGLTLKTYSYYDRAENKIDFAAMLRDIERIPEGDIVLLHGCCHNPTGADISQEQWDQVLAIMQARNHVAFIDVAYQGFGEGLEADAYGVRKAATLLPEVIIANSCSKNFGLYRERTGTAIIIGESASSTQAAASHVLSAARRCYSMSPYHGGGVAGLVMENPIYRSDWMAELEQIRARMNLLRTGLAEGLNAAQSVMDFSFIEKTRGMFCFLGIPEQAVLDLRAEYAIYLLNSTRINIAGLSEANLPIVIDRVAEIISR